MARHLIIWTDEEGDPRVRTLDGTLDEAKRALELLKGAYESHDTMLLIDDVDFPPLAAIEEEFTDVTGDPLP